jgi:hypothetical protein
LAELDAVEALDERPVPRPEDEGPG